MYYMFTASKTNIDVAYLGYQIQIQEAKLNL